MKQNPFSFYDFLGYLIPGAFLLYLIYFGGEHYSWKLAGEVRGYLAKNNNSLGDLLNLLPLVILSYIAGHFLSLISSFFIEKYSNYRNGFPSQYLFSNCGSGFFYKSDGICEELGRWFLVLIILPVSFLDKISYWKFRQNKRLDDKLRPAVFKMCVDLLKDKFLVDTSRMDESSGIDGDSFRLIYHYSFENSDSHAAKLQNYVALYGFARNITMVFIIVFWLLLSMKVFLGVKVGWSPIISSVVMAFVFYKGFVKFYRRYTLEAMMAVCAIKTREPK